MVLLCMDHGVLCVCDVHATCSETAYHNFGFAFPLSLTSIQAMEKSRCSSAPWSRDSSRRERDKRSRDEVDRVEDIVAKKKREVSGRLAEDADRYRRERDKMDAENDKLQGDNDRLRADNDRLRAEIERNAAASAQSEQQLIKRFKTALDDAFEEVLCAPVNEGATTDPSEAGSGPTLPEDTHTAAAGPGNAAPAREEEEDAKAQEQALETAVHSRSEMPPALGGQ